MHSFFRRKKWRDYISTWNTALSDTARTIRFHGNFHVRRAHKKSFVRGGVAVLVFLCVVAVGHATLFAPPADFPVGRYIEVQEGMSVQDISYLFERERVVRSASLFRLFATVSKNVSVRAGEYYFVEPLPVHRVFLRVVRGDFGFEPVALTFPEGSATYEMAELCAKKLPRCDAQEFYNFTKDKEGYLYPDTYFFSPNADTKTVVATLEKTFYEKVDTLSERIAQFGHPLHEVVTMASLLEKEAYTEVDRKKIAGVLWNRIAQNMPLQVDAVFGYIEGRDTFSPKLSDLQVDSPYNTYKNKGLPPGPIGNPSLASLEDAISPEKTTALYYLHGRDGVIRLARTFEEHKVNRRRFLD
jgi:UPF0755 protein